MINSLTSIEELYEMGLFSNVRIISCCENGDIHTVDDLLKYYHYDDSKDRFLLLHNCGKKTNRDFVSLCQQLEILLDGTDECTDSLSMNNSINRNLLSDSEIVFSKGFYANSTLEELYNRGIIPSIRIVNSCKRNKINTLGDLLRYYYSGKSLLDIKNFGKKCYFIVMDFIDSIKDEWECYFSSQSPCQNKPEDNDSLNLFADIVLDFCIKKELDIDLFDSFMKSDKRFDVRYRFGIKDIFLFYDFAINVRSRLDEIDRNAEKYNSSKKSILVFLNTTIAKLIAAVLTLNENCLSYINFKCRNLLAINNLCYAGHDVKSFLNNYCSICESDFTDSIQREKAVEVIDCLQESAEYLTITKTDGIVDDLEKWFGIKIIDKSWINDYFVNKGRFPLIKLVELYYSDAIQSCYKSEILDKSLKKRAMIGFYYGIGIEKPMPINDMCKMFLCSKQHVLSFCKNSDPIKYAGFGEYDWKNYHLILNPKEELIISFDSSKIDNIIDDEQLVSDSNVLVDLLINVLGYKIIRFKKAELVITDNCILEEFNVAEAMDCADKIINGNRVADKIVTVESMLPLNSSVKVVRAFRMILERFYKDDKNVAFCDDGIVLYKNHCIEMGDLAIQILKEHGDPMSAEAIFLEALEREPTHKVDNLILFKRCLYEEEEIVSLGKSGLYALKEWGIKHKTIRELVRQFLFGKESPQKIEDILQYVNVFYPSTNLHSLESSIKVDKTIVFIGNNKYMLANKAYEYNQKALTSSTIDFIKRMMGFIDSHYLFPAAISADSEEETLHKWWFDTICHMDRLNVDDRNAINEFKEKYRAFIPDNQC